MATTLTAVFIKEIAIVLRGAEQARSSFNTSARINNYFFMKINPFFNWFQSQQPFPSTIQNFLAIYL